jgi:molecular chaperone GrpE
MIDANDRAGRDDDSGAASESERREAEPVSDQEVAHAQNESAARIDSLMRALAEADNARKRAERLAAEVGQFAISDFARDLLLVADNLQRAIAAAETNVSDSKSLLEGVRATAKLLDSVLEQHGVRRVEARGASFDPRRHEAVAVIHDETRDPGEIVEVAEEGYLIKDRLLRPARVLVNNPNRKPAGDNRGQVAGS